MVNKGRGGGGHSSGFRNNLEQMEGRHGRYILRGGGGGQQVDVEVAK